MRRFSIEAQWYIDLLPDLDVITELVASGMGLKEITEKWEGAVKYYEMQQFISHNELKPESIPGMEVIKVEDIRDKMVSLDGSSYCLVRRNCETYVIHPISVYKKLIEDK